jgi:hypothetical protein
MTADRDDLDGCDILGPETRRYPWPDDEIDALVLFADVDPFDPDAVEARAIEWESLFSPWRGGTAP